MAKSVEEQVEEWAKKSLDDCGVRHFAKNAVINAEIGTALKTAAVEEIEKAKGIGRKDAEAVYAYFHSEKA